MESSPWWIDYRRQKYKPRPEISMEMIMRKSFIQVLKEYVNNCSVAGVAQMTNPDTGWKRRCAWVLIFCHLFGLVSYFFFYTWLTTLANPLILMPKYSTYSIADIDYPAVALCNINRISRKALKNQALILFKRNSFRNVSLEQIEEYLINSGRMLDFSYVENWSSSFANIDLSHQRQNFDTRKVIDNMKEMAPPCKEMLLSCYWAGRQVDCMSIFKIRRTSRGHCCAFNYVLDFDKYGHPSRTAKAKRQVLPGTTHGLIMVLDPMLDDYAYPLNYVKGFDVLLFEPTHFADPISGRVVHRFAEPDKLEFLELKSIRQTASPEVRKYPQSTRKCIFKDEKPDEFHQLYSYSACILRCRIRTVMSLCQCAPYFLPLARDDGPVCLLSDLPCLNKFKEKISHLQPPDWTQDEDMDIMDMEESLQCSECLPDCEHTRLILKSYKTTISRLSIDKYYPGGLEIDLNMTNKSVLSIYYASPRGDLGRLDVISYWYQIISNLGGFGGVCIGISVFSLIEIPYFFILRWLQEVYKILICTRQRQMI